MMDYMLPRRKPLNIAIVGGGNFYDVNALNSILGDWPYMVNAYIIDKNIWPNNKYSSKDLCNFNSVTLLKKDFFYELNNPTYDYDVIVFSRCINFTEYLNWSSYDTPTKYINAFIKLLEGSNVKKFYLIKINWSMFANNINSNSKDFDIELIEKLNKKGLESFSLGKIKIKSCEKELRCSRLMIIKK